MHLHTLANKPSMLKSDMQTCAHSSARSMLTTRTENSSCDGTDAVRSQDVLMIFVTGRKKEIKKRKEDMKHTADKHALHYLKLYY